MRDPQGGNEVSRSRARTVLALMIGLAMIAMILGWAMSPAHAGSKHKVKPPAPAAAVVIPPGLVCSPLEEAKKQLGVTAKREGGIGFILMGKDAAAYLDVINAVPPQTHLAGDGVIALAISKGVGLALITGDKACVVGHISLDVHMKALTAAAAAKAGGDKPKRERIEAPQVPGGPKSDPAPAGDPLFDGGPDQPFVKPSGYEI